MKPWEVIKLLETDNSRLFKEEVLFNEAEADNGQLFFGLNLCLNPLITFGIKNVQVKPENNGIKDILLDEYLSADEFSEVAGRLSRRELTGHKAIDAINSLMDKATPVKWNYWYRRILIKDLRCGVTEKTVNKAVEMAGKSEFSIPVFTCQLAQDGRDHEKKMNGNKIIDVKMDGSRVLSIIYHDRVDQFTRNGKEVNNFSVVKKQLEQYCSHVVEPVVVDGEIMSSSFQDLMKQMHRKENIQTDDAVLHLFDFIPLDDFMKGVCKVPQIVRREKLDSFISLISEENRPNIKNVGWELLQLSTEEGKKRMNEVNTYAIDNGYEGIMIKTALAPYECKRSSNWLKIKPFITVDLKIVGYEEGTGKNAGMLGAFLCAGSDQDKYIEVSVGGGFTDADRVNFWDDRESLIGRTVEVKADALSKSEDNDSYSLRFPVYLGFRSDKE